MAKKKEPWKEMLNLEERQVELKDVFFDPNNPRFASVERKPVPESRAEEIGIQQECLRKIKEEIGINDLKKKYQYGRVFATRSYCFERASIEKICGSRRKSKNSVVKRTLGRK